MPNQWGLKEGSKTASIFFTIDDAVQIARYLLAGLKEMGESKYPFGVRRGIRKGVRNVGSNEGKSQRIEAGSKTYFFDLLKAKNGNPYLKISESRSKGKNGEEERSSIIVFVEAAQDFAGAVSDMVAMLVGKNH